MRILIAEDDVIIADGLTRSLRQGGYAVDWGCYKSCRIDKYQYLSEGCTL